jgi:ABC-type lipoprotein release transport system permease subunit
MGLYCWLHTLPPGVHSIIRRQEVDRDALWMVSAGVAAVVPLPFWAETVADSLTRDLPVKSSASIVLGGVAVIAVALIAAYLPARKAM